VIRAFRIAKARQAARAFDGEGARFAGGRWNLPGDAVVYASSSLALAALETFVHLGDEGRTIRFAYFTVVIPDRVVVERCTRPPRGWRTEPPSEATMRHGSEWLKSGRAAVLEVPSVLVPGETNLLLNPAHVDFGKLRITRPRAFSFDPRLWS